MISGTSVRSNLVKRAFVNTFHDIDFAVVRPVVADGPVWVPQPWDIDHNRLSALSFFESM